MKYTENDAWKRVVRAKTNSLVPDRITKEYLMALRKHLYVWIKQIELKLTIRGFDFK